MTWYHKASDEDSSVKKYQPNQKVQMPSSYLDIGHDTGRRTIMWIHDGKNIHQKEVTNDQDASGDLANTNHSKIFPMLIDVGSGRIDVETNRGSLMLGESVFDFQKNMIIPNKRPLVNKMMIDLRSAFPNVSFTKFSPDDDIIRKSFIKRNWYKRASHIEPWQMTANDYVKDQFTGQIPSHAYESYSKSEGLGSFVKIEKYTELIDTININGINVEIRGEPNKTNYVKTDAQGEIVRDQNGLAVYLTDKEQLALGYPLVAWTIGAFANGQPVGLASDEFGTSGVWVVNDFQRKGLGVRLLEELHRLNPKLAKNKIGQMTNAGWNMTRAYHKRLVQKAIQEGKNVPPEILKDYPDIITSKQSSELLDVSKFANRITLPPNVYPEDRPVLRDTDVIRVFHGFRDIQDAIAACRYGISGKSRVGRVYSYEADNNPTGLFVATNPKAAAEFGAYIIEFNARGTELEAPVWPSGSYTVQGQMAQYFGGSKTKREEAREVARNKAIERKIEPISKSDRPELANTLMAFGENQALFVGHLNQNRIIRVWLRDNVGNLNPVQRNQFLSMNKKYKFSPQSGREAWLASSRLFGVDEQFSSEKLLQSISDKYGKWSPEEAKGILVRALGSKSVPIMKEELLKYVWPAQLPAALRWLGREFKEYQKNNLNKSASGITIDGPTDGGGHMTTDDPAIIFEAKIGNESAGYILVVMPPNKNPYVGQVTIKPDQRLKGIATALYNKVDSYLRENKKLPLKPSRDLSPGTQRIWDKRLRNPQNINKESQKLTPQQVDMYYNFKAPSGIKLIGSGLSSVFRVPGINQTLSGSQLMNQVIARISGLLIKNNVHTIDTSPVAQTNAIGLAVSSEPGTVHVDIAKIFETIQNQALPSITQLDGTVIDKDIQNDIISKISNYISNQLANTSLHESRHNKDYFESFPSGQFQSSESGAESFGNQVAGQYFRL